MQPLPTVRIGFIPLIDCALIAVAHDRGLAERRGVRLVPSREPSWATIRDKVAFGMLDAAHMLAPMPVAMTLGLGGPTVPMVAPMTLGLGGTAITVSTALHAAMTAADPRAMAPLPAGSAGSPAAEPARALARVVADRRRAGLPRLRFASVFPFSAHHYEVRLWLASGGLDPESDVELLIIPPPRMVENLASGLVDGFCVGEPWNQLAVRDGLGCIIATKADIAPEAPEKVLGLRRAWADENAATVAILVSALVEAAAWADAHHTELAALLARNEWVGIPAPVLLACLEGRPLLASGQPPASLPGYQRFADGPANEPRREHVTWLARQMTACGRRRTDDAAVSFDSVRSVLQPVSDQAETIS